MTTIFILCVIVGVLSGLQEMSKTHRGLKPGVKSSNNLFTFLFMDKY
jgi:hypothetical protein